MKFILLCLLLLVVKISYGQIALPPKKIIYDPDAKIPGSFVFDDQLYHWWFSYTIRQVRDKIDSEPGWKVEDIEEGELHDSDSKRMVAGYTRATKKEEEMLLLFEFLKGNLYKRVYAFNSNGSVAERWNEEVAKYPYDEHNSRWIDIGHRAQIQRIYKDDIVIYVIEIYSKDDEKESSKQ